MAKKNMFQKEIKKENIIQKYKEKRKDLIYQLSKIELYLEKTKLIKKLHKLPLNSSYIRKRNRCSITGRPRGFYRFFGLSRNLIREYGHKSLLPGLVKSSW
jgi:small subunit ribosomal protein S14